MPKKKYDEKVGSASEDAFEGFYGPGKIVESPKIFMDLIEEYYLDEDDKIDKSWIEFFSNNGFNLENFKIGNTNYKKVDVKINDEPISLDKKLNRKFEENEIYEAIKNSNLLKFTNGIGFTYLTRGIEIDKEEYLTKEDFKKDFETNINNFRKSPSEFEKKVFKEFLTEQGYYKGTKEEIEKKFAELGKYFEDKNLFMSKVYAPFYLKLQKELVKNNDDKKEVNLSAFNTKTITLARDENGNFVRQGDIYVLDIPNNTSLPMEGGKWLIVRMLGSNGGYIIKNASGSDSEESLLDKEIDLLENWIEIDEGDSTFNWKNKGDKNDLRKYVYGHEGKVVFKATRKLPRGESPICTVPAFPLDGKKHEVELRVGPYPSKEKECWPSCVIKIYTQ